MRLLTRQVFSIESSAGAAARLLPGGGSVTVSRRPAPSCCVSLTQVGEVDALSYPASQLAATSVNIHQRTHLVKGVVL